MLLISFYFWRWQFEHILYLLVPHCTNNGVWCNDNFQTAIVRGLSHICHVVNISLTSCTTLCNKWCLWEPDRIPCTTSSPQTNAAMKTSALPLLKPRCRLCLLWPVLQRIHLGAKWLLFWQTILKLQVQLQLYAWPKSKILSYWPRWLWQDRKI